MSLATTCMLAPFFDMRLLCLLAPFPKKKCTGIRYDGNVVEYDPNQSRWEVQFSWGAENWKLADVVKGFRVYCSGFMGPTDNRRLGLRRCSVVSCDKHAQGPKYNQMCQGHFREHSGVVAK